MKKTYYGDPRIVDTIPAEIVEKDERKTIHVPVFDDNYLRPGMCSAYVRLAAEKIFNKKFSYPCPTWQRKFKDKLVAMVKNEQELKEFADNGTLNPGMAIAFYNPLNPKNFTLDSQGFMIYPTHLTLFLGKSPYGGLVVAHQYGKATFVESVQSFKRDVKKTLLAPREIIASNDF